MRNQNLFDNTGLRTVTKETKAGLWLPEKEVKKPSKYIEYYNNFTRLWI